MSCLKPVILPCPGTRIGWNVIVPLLVTLTVVLMTCPEKVFLLEMFTVQGEYMNTFSLA